MSFFRGLRLRLHSRETLYGIRKYFFEPMSFLGVPMWLLSSRRITPQKIFEIFSNLMSFFGSQCCGKGVEGEIEVNPPKGRRAPAKTRRKKFSEKFEKACHFLTLDVAVGGWEEINRRNWLRIGAMQQIGHASGSESEPTGERKTDFQLFGISFDTTEKLSLSDTRKNGLSHS